MILHLHFTQEEMIEYLKKAGYVVSREMIEYHDHIHGSRFTHTWREKIIASKDEHTGPIEKVFTQVMKNKLLTI